MIDITFKAGLNKFSELCLCNHARLAEI